MSQVDVAVTAATGHIGRELALRLLEKGRKVRVIGRSAERLAALKSKGAEAFVGGLETAEEAARAFDGAKAAFLLIPPNVKAPDVGAWQRTIGTALAEGAAKAKVGWLVNLSSVGAHLSGGNGVVLGLHEQEERLNKLKGVNVLHLRPGYFMENHLGSVGMIKQMGIIGGALGPDTALAQIATRDIAAAAAEALLKLDFKAVSVLELLGPRDVTMSEAASVFGRAIGKPDLKYVQFPFADAEKAMVGMGLSPSYVKGILEMVKGFNEGKVAPTQKRSAKTATPTTLEEFAKTFAAAFKGEPAHA